MIAPLRMPAEWEAHAATLLAWPHHRSDWPGKFSPIPWVFAEIVRCLTAQERVRLLVRSDKEATQARAICDQAGADTSRLDTPVVPTNRGWMRDCGSIFVKDGRRRSHMLDFRFNGWAKYPDHRRDDRVPALLNRHDRLPLIQPAHKGRRIVLEGGSIDVNGKGALLTTEECLLSKTQERNPGFTREDYEACFSRYLGVRQVIWLGRGIAGDDTHGHVDDISRFTAAATVVTAVERDKRDANYAPLRDNLKRLKAARDQDGKQLTVVELPMPAPLYFDGQLLPASYANFYIANRLVLMPTFNDPNDRLALSILSELFKGRDVVGIHCRDLVLGLGTLHCLTQQQPA